MGLKHIPEEEEVLQNQVFLEPPYALTFLVFNSISESLKEEILGHLMAAKSPLAPL